MSNVIVLDLETIPDYSVWPEGAPTGVKAEDEAESAEPAEPKKRGRGRPKSVPFPPVYAHQIVCFGYLTVVDGKVTNLGAQVSTTKDTEAELLKAVAPWLETFNTYVTWNGKNFDMPVIAMRSLHHGVAQPWYNADVRHKYGSQHMDLCAFLSDYGYKDFSLDAIAPLLGLPGKSGFDGSMVHAMFKSGGINEIAAYCKRDVVQTAAIWFRTELLKGAMSLDEYRTGIASLIAEARKHDGTKHEEFRVDAPRLEAL